MVKLTADVIAGSPSYINAVKDRELSFRGLRAPKLENLAITKDLNDTLDLTDNDLRRLDGFPPMTRLKHLLCANNRIQKIDPDLPKYLPHLQTLILTNNQISELGDVDVLEGCKELHSLSLMDNPVLGKKYYRLYVIARCPGLRVLDFKKVGEKERAEARKMFSGAKGKALYHSLSEQKAKVFEPGEGIKEVEKKEARPYQGPSPEEAARIREAIANAKSMEEVIALEAQLKRGAIPDARSAEPAPPGTEVEMDEE
ncbi:leucine-rich repeat-domain-containing protein [Hyaloraphidium curvatum]|nr:leucine-rich repeat-domain-containing protein [Hyaloraphidium curvatum]